MAQPSGRSAPATAIDLILAAADVIADPPITAIPVLDALDRAIHPDGDAARAPEDSALIDEAAAILRERAGGTTIWDYATRGLHPHYRASLLRNIAVPPARTPAAARLEIVVDMDEWASRHRRRPARPAPPPSRPPHGPPRHTSG